MSVSVSVCMTLCDINQHKLGIQGQQLYKVRADVYLCLCLFLSVCHCAINQDKLGIQGQ